MSIPRFVPRTQPKPAPAVQLSGSVEMQLLRRRVADIDARLGEIGQMRGLREGSYELQEVRYEAAELHQHRASAIRKLDAILSPPAPTAAQLEQRRRRERTIESQIASRRRQIITAADDFARRGDYRQARIHRLSLLDVPANVVKEWQP